MNTCKPLISVITVCRNSEDHIEQTIRSVLNQTYPHVEYIIIDGGSKDKTLDIVKKYESRIAYWQSEKDMGIYDAMNKGLAHTHGDLISFLNSDDWYERNTLEEVAKKHLSVQTSGVVHGDIKIYRKNNFIKTRKPRLSPRAKLYFAWHPACFVPDKFFRRYGLFEDKYKIAGDLDFLLKLKKNRVDFYYTPQVVTNFRLEGASDKVWAGSMESFEIYKKYFPLATALVLLWERTVLRQINATISKVMSLRFPV